MNKSVELQIKNIGEAKGTVGWLAKAVSHVTLGTTKSGSRGAWLHFSDGTEPQCIVMHDPYGISREHPEFDRLEIVDRHSNGPNLSLKFQVTDAAWESIAELAISARNEMERIAATETPIRFSLSANQ